MTDRPSPQYWAESPAGIVTLDGGRFHTTEADLQAFAPQVMERYGMDTVLKMASVWHRLPTTKGLLVLVALLPYVAICPHLIGGLAICFGGVSFNRVSGRHQASQMALASRGARTDLRIDSQYPGCFRTSGGHGSGPCRIHSFPLATP